MTVIRFSFLLAGFLVLAGGGPLGAQQNVEQVEVINLPEIQRVEGEVEILGPVPQTRLVRLDEEVVSPADPEKTAEMVFAGTLESAGFGTAVLSVTGLIRAAFYQPGAVGAILIPDVEPARTAFLQEGQLLFPLRVEAQAAADGGVYFSSDQPLFRLGFDRYRIYFYNTTDRPATVVLFAYLGS